MGTLLQAAGSTGTTEEAENKYTIPLPQQVDHLDFNFTRKLTCRLFFMGNSFYLDLHYTYFHLTSILYTSGNFLVLSPY